MDAPTTPGKRGPKPNPNTRDNLLRAGTRAVHRRGFAATGVKDIVEAADVPKGSFYNHFPSKEAFGAEIADHYFEASLNQIRATLTEPAVNPVHRLRNHFTHLATGFTKSGYARGCLLGNLSLEVADHSDLIRSRLSAHFSTWAGLIENCIRQAQTDGDITTTVPAHVLAGFVLNSWEGALLRMRAEQSNAPLSDFLTVTFDVVLT